MARKKVSDLRAKDDKKIGVHYRLPEDVVKAVERKAWRQRKTQTAVVEEALRAHLRDLL